MKLSELAQQHNLATESIQEACELLKIKLPKGLDSDLKDTDAARVLSFGGLETVDGNEFTPIIAKEFEDKHKRSVAAKKAADTRKKKISEEDERKRQEDDIRLIAERRKHEEELARRDSERLGREAQEAAAAARRLELESLAKAEMDSARAAAEEDLRRRETEAKRISAEFAVLRNVAASAAATTENTSTGHAVEQPVDRVAAPAVTAPTKPVAEITQPMAPTLVPVAATPNAPVAVVPTTPTASDIAVAKATKGLGLKLASMAKATHEKADHSIKAIPKPAVDPHGATISKGSDEALSPEDRRRLIQENIRKNLAMAQRVRDNKVAEKGRRKPGFAPIDRSKTPGGPGGPGGNRGPARPGQRPGPPGVQRGPKRDSKDHRNERPEEYDKDGNKITNRRKALSTEDMDLSGKTEFEIALPCTVRELSEASGIKSSTVIAKLFMAGVMGNINSTLDKDTVELLAQEFKKTVTFIEAKSAEEELAEQIHEEDKPEDLAPRPPVVTIMGHVDHGKTSLLDTIKKSDVASGEAGGITQHIGAYTVTTSSGDEVTFIDTPGHEAFTEMRARGTKVTDVAVIVVDAVDGAMPQTIEAINHAKAAGVTIVVAMNKIDKPEATAQTQEKVLRQLAEQGLQAEEWGGETAVLRVSAKTGQGIPELLERLALETDVLELTANHFANASGTVLESHRHEGQGVTATLLVQRGSLAIGDIVLSGSGYGRVRALTNWKGEKIELAGPSHAVEVIGLSELPRAGERFTVVESFKQAADAAELRAQFQREKDLNAKSKVTTAATIFGDIAHKKVKEVKVVLKVDASGSLEVLNKAIPAMSTDEVRVTIVHSAVGAVSSNDVSLAEASKALMLAFHVTADSKARSHADQAGVDILTYTVIYALLDDIKKAMSGLLDPEFVDRIIGHAEVRATFTVTKSSSTVAGLFITDGRVTRDTHMRITREHVIIHTGMVNSLRRFKDDVKEVKENFECGMTIENFSDIKVGDTMEFFIKEKKARSL